MARYLIGVTIVSAKINSIQRTQFPTGAKTWRTEGSITTKWEVLDTKANRIVLNEDITISGLKAPGENIGDVVQQGLREAARKIAASSSFSSLP
jgi:hypothetical protein